MSRILSSENKDSAGKAKPKSWSGRVGAPASARAAFAAHSEITASQKGASLSRGKTIKSTVGRTV